MKTPFTKMHGAGNDFVVFDATKGPLGLTERRIARLADRHFGIGCDQILIVEPSDDASIDFVYRIYNADGGEVEQCGNGARAFVRFVVERALTQKRAIRVRTASGVIEPTLLATGDVVVDMGPPSFRSERVPFDAADLGVIEEEPLPVYRLVLEHDGRRKDVVDLSVCSMGNPHAILLVSDVAKAEVTRLGALLEHHPRFAHRVNVGFMQIENRHAIRLRVWERGTGETLSCGTGACAAAAVGIRRGLLDSPVTVQTHGGTLTLSWDGIDGHAVFLAGPAVTVYEGAIDLTELD